MKYSHYEHRHLQMQLKGLRSFMLFVVVAIIVIIAIYSAKKYWKVPVRIEQEPARQVVPER